MAYLDAVVTAGEGAQSLEVTVQRFVESVWSGKYPLMPGGGIRPYQLFDACARSPRVRERYVALVSASIDRVMGVIRAGQGGGSTRDDVPAEAIGPVLLAVIIGAQTMIDLGAPFDIGTAALTVLKLLARPEGVSPNPRPSSPSPRPSPRKRAKRP